MSRRGNGLAAFIAGFGSSYLTNKRYRDDREARERREKREDERWERQEARLDKIDKQDDAVSEGLSKASELRPGETLSSEDGTKYDTSANSFQQRLLQADPTLNPAVAANAAQVYEQRAQGPEAAEWLDKGFDGSRVRPTTEADVVRTQGAAYAKGGARYADKAANAQKEATKLDLKKLQADILKTTNIEELSKKYDEIDDGRSVHAEEVDGQYVVYTTDEDTGRTQLVGKFKDFTEYRDGLAAIMNDDPDATLAYLSRQRQLKEQREDREADNRRMDERYAADSAHRDRMFDAQQRHQRVTEGHSAAQLQLSREKHQADMAKEVTEGNIALDDKGKPKPGAAGGKIDTATLKYVAETAEDVAQQVAAVLDAKGQANFKDGKNRYSKVRFDETTGEQVTTGAKYIVNPKLEQHAQKLISHGVPKADAIRLLSERKKVQGKFIYSNMGKATVAGEDGKPQTRWGFMYQGRLIPLDD